VAEVIKNRTIARAITINPTDRPITATATSHRITVGNRPVIVIAEATIRIPITVEEVTGEQQR